MTSLQRAPRRVRRAGTLLIPSAIGTVALLPAAPAVAAPVPAAAADLAAFSPAVAGIPDATSVGMALNRPVIGGAASGGGFVLAATDGGVFSVSGAGFFGSMGGQHLNQPVVGVASTPSGRGYWLVASDGGVFTFGDARFLGSMGGRHLNQPIVGIAATPSGRGYWLVASDGGVFTFGDAPFLGSLGNMRLRSAVTGIAADPAGRGYWMSGADGGVFAFGAPFLGSASGRTSAPVTAIAAAPGGAGYWLAGADGSVFAFGAPFQGAPLNAGQGDVIGIAAAGGSYRLFTTNGTVLGPNDAGAVRATSVSSGSVVAASVVDGINGDRAARGLGPLATDATLTGLAQDWSRQMAARNTLSHRDLSGVLGDPAFSGYSTLGETIYVGDATTTSSSDVASGWQNSPVHQAVLVDGRFNVVGVGVYASGGKVWVTADFGGR